MTGREREGLLWIQLAALLLIGIGIFGTVLPVLGVNIAIQRIGAALIVGSVIALQLRPRNRIDLSIAHEAG